MMRMMSDDDDVDDDDDADAEAEGLTMMTTGYAWSCCCERSLMTTCIFYQNSLIVTYTALNPQ